MIDTGVEEAGHRFALLFRPKLRLSLHVGYTFETQEKLTHRGPVGPGNMKLAASEVRSTTTGKAARAGEQRSVGRRG